MTINKSARMEIKFCKITKQINKTKLETWIKNTLLEFKPRRTRYPFLMAYMIITVSSDKKNAKPVESNMVEA